MFKTAVIINFDHMKKLKKLKGASVLSKASQKKIAGGIFPGLCNTCVYDIDCYQCDEGLGLLTFRQCINGSCVE